MYRLITYFVYGVLRILLSLRYRIEVVGLSKIKNSKGILFLPNHPAEVDPLILVKVLWPKYKMHPLVVESFYYQKGIRFFMNLIEALPLPTIDMANQWKVKQIEKLKVKIGEGLKEGKNFLIYPSGKLKVAPKEQVGGASLVAELINMHPQASLVLVRTTGLWGSLFSKALTGSTPDFGKSIWKGVKILLKNGIFFAPRRTIKIEFEEVSESFPKQGAKLEINGYLEEWYNRFGPEPLKLVSYAFWKEELPMIKQTPQQESKEELFVSNEIREQILAYLSKISHKSVQEIDPNWQLSNELGLDSLDVADLYIYIEEHFGNHGIAPGQIQTVKDLFRAATGVQKEIQTVAPHKKKSKWPSELHRLVPHIPKGETIQEVFLNTCERMGDAIACTDGVSPALSYHRLKKIVLILALKIKEMPGERIGIVLPASVGAYTVILATLFAGKVPVMLNWTAGFRNLEHAVEVCSLKTVLSSRRFLSRLDNVDLGRVDELLVLLEEVREKISLATKLKGLYSSFLSSKKILKNISPNLKKEDPAVVIFTSGTETLPKGVPLTHHNLLSNQRAAFACVKFLETDIMYGILPPFHSFGFSVTGLLPLLAGLKVCYAPDPTDAQALIKDIEYWKPTLFASAPGFAQAVFRIATEEQVQSLRLIVTGAEKAPKEFVEALAARNKKFLEGYGISECSPVVTLNREAEPLKGVGKPLAQVELCVIDTDKHTRLAQGQEGEVCIYGPNVFQGYIGTAKDPFIEIEGKRWYRSGDRGYLTEEGALILTGRLTRFIKIGGEMVGLGGLEEDILAICEKKNWKPSTVNGPILAVSAIDTENEKSTIILFATFSIDRDQINEALKEKGYGRLVRITEVRTLAQIPLTGTGKTHYRYLEEQLKSHE